MTVTALPLDGVRVVDFTWLGAGPYTTRTLADHGAEVIRIESAKRTDRLRVLPPFAGGRREGSVNRSGYFADRNSNKLGVTINLKDPAGVDLVLRLIATADVVASNFTPGTLQSLGLGYEQARAVKPDIIFLEMGMQGATGPDASVVGYGQTVSALTGLYHLSGLPGRVPVGTGTNYPDHVPAPAHSAFAVLVALRHHRRTGEGQYIDLSQAETMVSLLGPAVLDCSVNGRDNGPRGNRADYAAPQGVYPAAGEDRWIAISVLDDAQWTSLTAELDVPELADAYPAAADRHAAHDEIDAALAKRTAAADPFELAARLQARGVPAAAVNTFGDLIESDPQLAHRGHFAVLDHPEMGPSVYNAPPYRLRGVDGGDVGAIMRTPAPLLGQHTRDVCSRVLGLDDATIDELAGRGVLG
ncbi:CaiB/BaiF CoA transferase family protein [Actinomadura syzygii]|uniref:CoA transferase n=1 Tax=Actinomadura syzygii TaxID=1427538 RepID=A0A5D0U823_9ACTN|nr:CoA transferase [Actinomadura syzygii]TYC13189.1 CoA transferase [Actinomadura syzygii]